MPEHVHRVVGEVGRESRREELTRQVDRLAGMAQRFTVESQLGRIADECRDAVLLEQLPEQREFRRQELFSRVFIDDGDATHDEPPWGWMGCSSPSGTAGRIGV